MKVFVMEMEKLASGGGGEVESEIKAVELRLFGHGKTKKEK